MQALQLSSRSRILNVRASSVADGKRTRISALPRQPKQRDIGYIGFTEDNEVFVGRVAMLGVAASIVGEVTTGLGPIAQFTAETGITQGQVDWLVAGLVAFNMVSALLPSSRTFAPEEQAKIATRPLGPMQDPNITVFDKRFYGISGRFGFTKENELFVGRLAQIGFASALVFEQIYGQGPLTYFDMKTGIPVTDTEFIIFSSIVFSLFGAIGATSKKN